MIPANPWMNPKGVFLAPAPIADYNAYSAAEATSTGILVKIIEKYKLKNLSNSLPELRRKLIPARVLLQQVALDPEAATLQISWCYMLGLEYVHYDLLSYSDKLYLVDRNSYSEKKKKIDHAIDLSKALSDGIRGLLARNPPASTSDVASLLDITAGRYDKEILPLIATYATGNFVRFLENERKNNQGSKRVI